MCKSPCRGLVLAAAACSLALAAPASAPAAPGQLIVRFAPHADAGDRAAARRAAGVTVDEALPVSGLQVVDPKPGTSPSAATSALERSDDVLYAERDERRSADQLADDPFFLFQWGLTDISAPAAWDVTTGDPSVAVAVVDTGIDLTHPDLAPNLWHDAAGDGGWDFVDEDGTPADANGHGTHVAGTIAASGDDGVGVTGVAWKAALMPLRALDATGAGYTSDLVRAYAYAEEHGARVVNASLSGPDFSQAEYDAIRAAKDVLFVVAAGNDGTDDDTSPKYPCAYDLPNVLCVAATGISDSLASFSNYGSQSVDIGAPGVGILSTWPSNGYRSLSGTSMATPHVAGAAALLFGERPALTPWQARETLLESVDPAPALAGRVSSGGRLDVAQALQATPPAASLQPASKDLDPPTTIADPPSTQPDPTSGSPGGSPGGGPPPAFTLGLATAARAKLAAALSGRLRPLATCSLACRVSLALTIDARTARRLHLTRGTRAVTIARAMATLSAAGSRAIAVRLTSRARHALKAARSLHATLRATATDAAGARRAQIAALLLSR